jgi:hypothetical protein
VANLPLLLYKQRIETQGASDDGDVLKLSAPKPHTSSGEGHRLGQQAFTWETESCVLEVTLFDGVTEVLSQQECLLNRQIADSFSYLAGISFSNAVFFNCSFRLDSANSRSDDLPAAEVPA